MSSSFGPSAPEAPTAAPTGSRAMDARSSLVLGALLLVSASGAGLHSFPGEPPLDEVNLKVPPWGEDPEEASALDATLDARLQAAREVSKEDSAAVLAAYQTYNLEELRHGDGSRHPTLLDTWADYEQWALSTLSALGETGYLALGARLGEQVIRALEGRETEEVRRLAGSFAEHARATGLMGADGPITRGRTRVVRAALMDRWCRAVIQRRTLQSLLTREERELLLRWKLAANPLVLPPRRVEIARELARLESTYPVVEALAARAAQDGQWSLARQLYGTVLEQRPGDRRIRANIAYLASRSEGGQTP